MMILSREDILARVEGLSEMDLDECINQGWITVSRREGRESFEEIDAARLRLILELRRDFVVSDEAMPLVLGLVDQVHGLRHALARVNAGVTTPSPAESDALEDIEADDDQEPRQIPITRWRPLPDSE